MGNAQGNDVDALQGDPGDLLTSVGHSTRISHSSVIIASSAVQIAQSLSYTPKRSCISIIGSWRAITSSVGLNPIRSPNQALKVSSGIDRGLCIWFAKIFPEGCCDDPCIGFIAWRYSLSYLQAFVEEHLGSCMDPLLPSPFWRRGTLTHLS